LFWLLLVLRGNEWVITAFCLKRSSSVPMTAPLQTASFRSANFQLFALKTHKHVHPVVPVHQEKQRHVTDQAAMWE
jgi:hypothetical protein